MAKAEYNQKDQKALNNVFIVTVVLSICLFFFGLRIPNVFFGLPSLEIVLYPLLSYIAKKGNEMALKLLLLFFLIDRVIVIGNLLIHYQRTNFILPVIVNFILGYFFYGAYKVFKSQKNRA